MDLLHNHKGNKVYLLHEGFLFIKESDLVEGRTFWRCIEHGKTKRAVKLFLFFPHYSRFCCSEQQNQLFINIKQDTENNSQ